MTYMEWRDELKSNLLCVSESERRRVLEYYAEAYADRREAGFSEREIIVEFGAPYDAAQRILNEERDFYEAPKREIRREPAYYAPPAREEYYEEPPRRPVRRAQEAERDYKSEEVERKPQKEQPAKKKRTSWVFVLLCIVFAIPIFVIMLALGLITFLAFIAPFAVLMAGIAEIGLGAGIMFSSVLEGLMRIGFGLMLFGVGVILSSILPRIAKLIRWIFKKIGGGIKSLFTTEEA